MEKPLGRAFLNPIIYTTVLGTLAPHLAPLTHPQVSETMYLQLHLSLGNALDLRGWFHLRKSSPRESCGQRLVDAGMQSPSTPPPPLPPPHTHTYISQCMTSPKSQTSSRPHIPFVLGCVEVHLQSHCQSSAPPVQFCLCDSVFQKFNVKQHSLYFQEGNQIPNNTMLSRILPQSACSFHRS